MNRHERPNVLITGTPCTGKSTLSMELAKRINFNYINVGEFAKDNQLVEGWDDDYTCYVIDEDKVIDELESTLSNGGNIIDYHSCEFFPERWFDAVYVLRTDNTILFDRLMKRNYKQEKITENIECEIFQTILEEANHSYRDEIVFSLQNNTSTDMENNLNTIAEWIGHWKTA